MASRNATTLIAALVSLTLVARAAIGAGSNGGTLTARAIAGNAIANDTSTLSDFDGDGTIGFGDFVKFAARFGRGQGDDGYDADYDLDDDGSIGFSDPEARRSQEMGTIPREFGYAITPPPRQVSPS